MTTAAGRRSPGNPLTRVTGAAATVTAVLSGLALAALTMHVVIDVLSRWLLGRPLPATIEIVGYWWMPLVVFAALGLAERRGDHIVVTFLTDGLRGVPAGAARWVATAITVAILLALVWFTWLGAWHAFEIGEVSTGAALIPIWPTKFLVPIGFAVWTAVLVAEALAAETPENRS